MYGILCSANTIFRNWGEKLMDADGNKGAVPGRSCNKQNDRSCVRFLSLIK